MMVLGVLAVAGTANTWAAARHRAGYVLVNPLHAAAPTVPMEPSPYLPTSRRFVNPLYLRVEAIAEFAYVPGLAFENDGNLVRAARQMHIQAIV